MHVAIGITLQHKATGTPCRISAISAQAIALVQEYGEGYSISPDALAKQFQEFGPEYELHESHKDGAHSITMVHLERCPFCGSTNLDPAAGLSGPVDGIEYTNEPGCDDCGATAPSVAAWNKRMIAPPVAVLTVDVHAPTNNIQIATPRGHELESGNYNVYKQGGAP